MKCATCGNEIFVLVFEVAKDKQSAQCTVGCGCGCFTSYQMWQTGPGDDK